MLTPSELERHVYMVGKTRLAAAYAALETLDRIDNGLPYGFDFETPLSDQIDNHVDREIENRCPDYEAYKQFFEDCFERLDGHYPCPSVTSDYDKSIIFDAIEKGSE
jgi:hypothetical protein